MQKKICKKSMGLLLFVITAMMIFPLSVNAADSCETFTNEVKNVLDTRYGITIDHNADNDLITIRMNVPDALKSIKNKLKFKIVSVTEKISQTTLYPTDEALASKMKTANVLTDSQDIVIQNLYSNVSDYEFTLAPDGYIDPAFQKACPDAVTIEYYVVLAIQVYGKSTPKTIVLKEEVEIEPTTSSKIDCNVATYKSTYTPDTFEYKFCEMKEKASKKSTTKKYDFTTKTNTGVQKFTCDPFVSMDANYYKDKGYYLEENTSYLIGTKKNSVTKGKYKYTYNYGAGRYKTIKDVTCEAKCEEVVSVEYGAPVASKAGLCFEYKVRVTSRVNCETTVEPPEPLKPKTICTPTPRCVHSWGFVFTQAGPNSKFDSCIYACDGGKYTTKCSNKCYKQVYGSSSSTKTSNPDISFNDVATQIDEILETNYANKGVGSYIYDSSTGRYTWSPPQNIARWFIENEHKINWRDDYDCVQGGGILSLCECDAVCTWTGCETGDQYINEEEAQADYTANKRVYNTVKKKCASFASCTTTQATFSIDVDYNYHEGGQIKNTTIYFPYTRNDSTSKDTIQYKGDANNTVECTTNANSTLISVDGCYRCGQLASTFKQNMYQTEWGFPGTWINNKTYEIYYEPVNGSIEYKNKFCLPLDAADTNYEWWSYYFERRYGSDTSYSFNDEEYMNNIKCTDGSIPESVSCDYSTHNGKFDDLDYNIRAHARDFGYFGWNIDISCFYALNNEHNKCYPECPNSAEGAAKVQVRSVDLANMFPSPDGTPLADPNTTGRTPPFNWYLHADNEKDEEYTSEPLTYLQKTQGLAYRVYDDDYLDYGFDLTTKDLQEIIKYFKNNPNICSEMDTNSANHCFSTLIREVLADHAVFPDGQAVKCNNMKNHDSSECEDFSE